jgi:hypothetical protein
VPIDVLVIAVQALQAFIAWIAKLEIILLFRGICNPAFSPFLKFLEIPHFVFLDSDGFIYSFPLEDPS